MKKSLLLTGTAMVLLTAATGFAAETPDTIRAALDRLVQGQPLLGDLIDTDRLQIAQDGSDFVLTMPATETPARSVRLVADGSFNGRDQYRIDGFFDAIRDIVADLTPATVTTEKSDSSLTWVPHYNLITHSSQNILNFQIDIPSYARVSVGRIVTDSLMTALADNRLDQAGSQDMTNLTVATQDMTLTVPTVSYQGSIQNAPLAADTLTQVLLADRAAYQLTVPTLMLTSPQAQTPLGTLSFTSEGLYRDDMFNVRLKADKITLDPTLRSLLPVTVLPTEVTFNADITGLNREELQKHLTALQTADTPENRAAFQEALADWDDNIGLKIHQLEAKSADAGILVQGTLENRDDTPQMDLTVTITNLDRISPPPVIDQAACDEARKQQAAVTPSDPAAATQKTIADFVAQQACSPRGGFLDALRPYLNERTADGKDIVKILLRDGVLTINGRAVSESDPEEGTDTPAETVKEAVETDAATPAEPTSSVSQETP